MKSFFKYFGVLVTVSVSAQSGNVSLKWNEQVVTVGENTKYSIPALQEQQFTYRTDLGLIETFFVVNEGRAIDTKSLKISNIRTQRLTKQYKDIDAKSISNTFQYSISFGSADGVGKNTVTYIPFIKKGNEIHQIISFDYSYRVNNVQRNATFNTSAGNSVLASGSWFKIKVNETGIYKLDQAFLTQLGIPTNVDPRTIKIYGHGGRMLPLKNSDNLYYDNPENAIFIQGENDGVLDASDYVLFYGEGTRKWDPFHASHHNLYSDDSFYYITYGGSAGKRVQTLSQPSGTAEVQFTDANERIFHEIDAVNIANLSRKWFGETFTTSFTNSYSLGLTNVVSTKPAKFSGNVAGASSAESFMQVSLNGTQVGNYQIAPKGDNHKGNERYFEYEIANPTPANQINIQFNNNGVPSARGYVDFVAIDYYKNLVGYGRQFGFRNAALQTTPNVAEFVISNASSISQIWDVTDPINPRVTSNNLGQITLKVQGGSDREFRALDIADAYVALPVGPVANQNLKGTIFNDGPVDYLLITNPELLSAANRLAQFHKSKNGFNVKVVSIGTIYEEFSSGKQDISAIRNFIKYVYDNSPDANKKVKYVNLFGDTTVDYKSRVTNNSNLVPIFQSLNNTLSTNSQLRANLNDQVSFSTDDFYGLMDAEEGLIVDQSYIGIDIAVGRMVAENIAEANAMVDKVIAYHDKNNSGRWKLNGIALADDVDTMGDRDLQSTLNNITDELTAAKPLFNIRKILMDSYTQEVSSGGPRYPKAKQEFYQAIESGALFVNYLGHGGEQGLSGERMMDNQDISGMNNGNRLPLFIIITCEFTRFDNPDSVSGGERLVKKANGGAISLLATSRKIGITYAQDFIKLISRKLFNTDGTSTNDISIAEALRLSKNENPSEKGVVNYLGDPALKLAVPKPEVVLTKINNIDVSQFDGSLRALDLVKLEGKVQTEEGTFLSSFNGDLAVQIYDKNIDRQTLGNDGVFSNGQLHKMDFKTLGETVFKGNAKVENGIFQIEFMVPKDIKMSIGEGKISFYAIKDGEVIDDFSGANTSVKVGGINNNAAEDNKAPEIKLYMNDEAFIYGGITNESPLFLAVVEDENGINTASGIGHDMVAILDGDENNPIVVNEFYETEANNFRKGFVKYPFKDLTPGVHNIVFKAWDSYNNMGTAEIQFVVSDQQGVSLNNVLNYPNPFIDYTEFWFEHNRPNEPLQVQVQILSVAGRIVKTINQTVVNEGFNSRDLNWDGKDDYGNKVGKGVYIYKLKVKSTLTGKQVEKIEKLVIL